MDAQTLLLEALIARWERYLSEVQLCRDEFSEEAVHDLRVAARRLLALVDLIRTIAPHRRLEKIREALKRQLDEFDELRDTQVMLAGISGEIETLPELKPFQEWLQKRERRLLREAGKLVEALKFEKLEKRLGKVRASLTEQAASADFNGPTLQAVDTAYLTVIQRYSRVDPAQPATIHRTRVAFKKFRYMVEIIHPLLLGFPEANLKRMHAYQTAMGEIQDAEVFLHALADFAGSDAPQPAIRYFEHRHAELIAAYLETQGEILSFWRPGSESSFPWEVENEPVHHPARHRRRKGDARLRAGQPAPADR